MVKINDTLDLRSPEFIASRRLFKPRLLKVLAVIFCTYIFTGFYFGLTIYISYLHNTIQTEKVAVRMLALKTVPLTFLAEETACLERKFAIENNLHQPGKPLSLLLQHFYEAARSNRIILESITVDENGTVLIKGSSAVMQNVSLFNQALADLSSLSSSAIVSIEMCGDNAFYFTVSGNSKNGIGEITDE